MIIVAMLSINTFCSRVRPSNDKNTENQNYVQSEVETINKIEYRHPLQKVPVEIKSPLNVEDIKPFAKKLFPDGCYIKIGKERTEVERQPINDSNNKNHGEKSSEFDPICTLNGLRVKNKMHISNEAKLIKGGSVPKHDRNAAESNDSNRKSKMLRRIGKVKDAFKKHVQIPFKKLKTTPPTNPEALTTPATIPNINKGSQNSKNNEEVEPSKVEKTKDKLTLARIFGSKKPKGKNDLNEQD